MERRKAKPDMENLNFKSELKKLYPCRIEMHAHTSPVSVCSEIPPEEMMRTYSDIGYDAVVITNHFTESMFDGMSKKEAIDYYINDYEKCAQLSGKYNVKVYLGAEIRFERESSNDYLIYGVDRKILEDAYDYLSSDIRSYRENVKLDKSLFIQAHPFRGAPADASLLDGVEAFNMHHHHNSRIALALRFAKANDFKIITSGSDFHHPNVANDGNAAIRTKKLPSDSFELAKILKSGDYIIDLGPETIVLP